MKSQRTIEFPLELDVVKNRLRFAFNKPVEEYQGFFFPTYTYSAQINDDTINLSYIKSGRNGLNSKATGKIFKTSLGTTIELTVKDSYLHYLPMGLAALAFLFPSRLQTLLTFLILIPLITIFITWDGLTDAADNIHNLLRKVVMKERSDIKKNSPKDYHVMRND